jgi:hypothetical protein
VDCFTQPIDPNYFVLLNLVAKKMVNYSVGLIQEKIFEEATHILNIFFPEIEDTAVILGLSFLIFSLIVTEVYLSLFNLISFLSLYFLLF